MVVKIATVWTFFVALAVALGVMLARPPVADTQPVDSIWTEGTPLRGMEKNRVR